MKRIALIGVLASAVIGLTGCVDDAQVASRNLSKAADNFEVPRRIVFYNGITGEYMLSIEGYCSQEPNQGRIAVICKDGGEYKKHFLGLSDNVTYFSEQMSGKGVSTSRYRVTFKPSVIVPDIEVR